jgi:hypothetical protein
MTEQPTEQDFLGNSERRPAKIPLTPPFWVPDSPAPLVSLPEPSTDLLEEAQVSATHGIQSIEKGELDAGIAWLQSALAFAQNARHARLSAPLRVIVPGVSE